MLDDTDPFHPCNHTRNNEGGKSSKLTVRSHEHHPSILSLIPPTQTQPDILPPPPLYLSFIAKNFSFIVTLVLSRWCSLIVFDRTLSISLQELRFLLTSSFELAARRLEKLFLDLVWKHISTISQLPGYKMPPVTQGATLFLRIWIKCT